MTHSAFIVSSALPTADPLLLTQALTEFKTFSEAHQGELIILDFHRIIDSAQANISTEAALITLIETQLTGRIIPRAGQDSTFSQIIQTYAHPQRIIVAYNGQTTTNMNFWTGVTQVAPNFDTGIHSRSEVWAYIKGQYDANTYTGLSSAQAAQSRGDLGPMSMYYGPEEFCTRVDLYSKLNICHVDFPENGFLVEALIPMNGAKTYVAPQPTSAVINGVFLLGVGIISFFLFNSSEEYI